MHIYRQFFILRFFIPILILASFPVYSLPPLAAYAWQWGTPGIPTPVPAASEQPGSQPARYSQGSFLLPPLESSTWHWGVPAMQGMTPTMWSPAPTVSSGVSDGIRSDLPGELWGLPEPLWPGQHETDSQGFYKGGGRR